MLCTEEASEKLLLLYTVSAKAVMLNVPKTKKTTSNIHKAT